MNFLQKVYFHVNNYCILSDLTIVLMGISILIMTGVYLFHMFFKKQLYEKNINIAGVIARVLMLVAFSCELYHQMRINSFINFYFTKDGSIEQFINFLFVAYIGVVRVYYIFTIGMENRKGFFYTFDIAMLSVPVLQGIVVMIFDTIIEGWFGPFYYLSIILYVLTLCSFFKVYWLRNKKWYIISFILSIGLMAVSSLMKEWGVTGPIGVFIFLIIIYEFLRLAIKNSNKLTKSINIVLTCVAIILIIFCNPVMNIWNIVSTGYADNNVDVYRAGTCYNGLENAKQIARKAVGNYDGKIVLISGQQQDFYNGYLFEIGDYSVGVDESSDRLLNVNREYKRNLKGNYIKESIQDIKLSNKDIIDKSISYVTKMGFNYDPKLIDLKLTEENSNQVGKLYNVKFCSKYNDGSIVKEQTCCSEIIWREDGTLESFSNNNMLNLKDYKEVTINYTDIDNIIRKWYKSIKKKMPAYAVVNIGNWYLNPRLELKIQCEDKDELVLDGNTGEVLRYTDGQENSDLNYCKQETLYKNIEDFDIENMKISKEDAVSMVLKKYKSFNVYNKRVKQLQVVDKDGHSKFKWMVIVFPYGTREHHIYFVDSNTGEIRPLDDYKVGVKSEKSNK